MKRTVEFFLHNVLGNIIAGFILIILTGGTISAVILGNFLQFFRLVISMPVWLIIMLVIPVSLLIVDYYRKILELKKERELIKENNVYWKLKKNGSKEGSYCPRCWESDIKKISIHPRLGTSNQWLCPECLNWFPSKQHTNPDILRPTVIPRDDEEGRGGVKSLHST